MIFNKKIFTTLIALITCLSFTVNAFSAVKVVKNREGVWKLLVDHKPYFVKGIAYCCDRVGFGMSNVNDWMWQDINNNGLIDGPYESWLDLNRDNYRDNYEDNIGDFALLKAMGCNTIRVYHSDNINKELLRDLYYNYGIMVIMGNFFGAYTKGSSAAWSSGTSYLNEKQRQAMLESVREMVEEHKNEPYVLMWMLGNENDVSGNSANSTATNTNAWKYPEVYAKFVEEACKMIKKLDDNKHPVGVCNATTRFIKYYAKHSPSIDVLGFNQYGGPYGFSTLWNRVKKEFDRPVLITEYGCDSWNEKKKSTCEAYQARYHYGAWKNIENNSFWGDGAGNSIGGVAYSWMDRWWLVGSSKVHDTHLGAWPGSTIDGEFNDEWLGICSQGKGKHSPFQRVLKRVYYTYQEELWDWDPATY
ncbi:MAG: hypothetical protein IKN62_01355 [Elusimicrobia bacterium]|nr:hypothetical protein [Elusimicrobiota bacterium]